MIVKNSQQDIVIDEPDDVTKVGLRISGGADSAIVGYMLSKYVHEHRPDITIVPITVVHGEKPFQEIYSKRVIDFLQQQFGDIFYEHFVDISPVGKQYVSKQEELTLRLFKENKIHRTYSGITKNPPKNVYEKFNGTGPDDDRDTDLQPTCSEYKRWPLKNIDKKGVKELYQNFGLLETLYPITRSCEAYEKDEAYDIDHHCGKCWWCQERSWGFE